MSNVITTIINGNREARKINNTVTRLQYQIIIDAAGTIADQQIEAQYQELLVRQTQVEIISEAIDTGCDFVKDRFSTPEKTKNTFAVCAVACDGVAIATTAYPLVSQGFAIAGWIFGGIAVAIDICMEE